MTDLSNRTDPKHRFHASVTAITPERDRGFHESVTVSDKINQ